jgi:DNA-binding NtrC family response regulator
MIRQDSILNSTGWELFCESPRLCDQKKRFRADMLWLFVDYFCQERTLDLKELIEKLETGIILRTLSKKNGDQGEAAKALGLDDRTFSSKLKQYGIQLG